MNNYGKSINKKALQNVAVIGSGSWATALVKVFSESGTTVSWLVRDNQQAAAILANGRNPRYLSFATLRISHICPSDNIEDVLAKAELIIFALPAAYLAALINDIDPVLLENKHLVASIKGFIPGTGSTPGNYLSRQLHTTNSPMVIAGPCHAEEIATGRETYITIAVENTELVNSICNSITAPYIHTVANSDPRGVEYVSILKNIIGIAAGIAHGLNYGVNFQAVIVSNSMREIERFLNAVHPAERSLHQSVYFGDLLATAYSDFSRNRTLGNLIGRGMQVNKALQSMAMIAEGYHASREVSALVQDMGLSLPIINSTYRILHQHATPFHEFKLLENQLS